LTRKKHRRGGLITFLIILAALAVYMYYGNFTLDVTEYELAFANLPASFDGYRIAVVSDLHAAVFGKDNAKLLAAVRDSRPDMIALTGDVTDDAGQIPGVLKTVAELAKIAPVYYVTGNHEWEKGEVRELLKALPGAGATVLQNVTVPLTLGDDTIYLTGLEDPNGSADMKTPAEVFAEKPDGFSVTLVHRNTFLEKLAPLGADLILCGHAHGGLIRFPGTDGLFDHNLRLFPTYTNGVYTAGDTTMLVSRGVGNHTGLPRILNRPHIPVAILRSYT
jgi:predicted MPP superfamily phosphohydrolase